MVWCGYDADMEVGVRQFGAGLVRALQRRSDEENISLDRVAELELLELSSFSDELRVAHRGPRTKALEGLTSFVHGLIETSHSRALAHDISFEAALNEEITVIAALIQPLEERYQALSPKNDTGAARTNGLQELAAWVAEQ